MPIYDPLSKYAPFGVAEEAIRRWRETMDSPAQRAMFHILNNPVHQRLSQLARPPSLFGNERKAVLEELSRIEGTISPYLKQHREMIDRLTETFRFHEQITQAMRPSLDMIASFRAASDVIEKMKGLNSAWALAGNVTLSMQGFARLSDFSSSLHTEVPFSRQVSALLDDELGSSAEDSPDEDDPAARDAAAIVAGMKPELIAFPPSAFSNVLLAAGFNFSLAVSPPIAIEAPDSTAVFDYQHGRVLLIVELALRQFVAHRLQAACGPNWLKTRVPNSLREQWGNRQETERAAGLPVYAPIHYAHLIELRDVIVRKDNWKDTFKEVFRYPEHISVSLERLHPIRLLIAHPRPLPRSAELTLVAEAIHLLRAIDYKGAGQKDF